MSVPRPPERYDPRWASEVKREVDNVNQRAHKREQDIEVGGARVILTSPNGTRYALTIDNAGALSTVLV
jgi:hypothetical protein